MKERLPLIPDIHSRIRQAVADGRLPLTQQFFEERLMLIIEDVLDPLAYTLNEPDGEFDRSQHAVHLSATIPLDEPGTEDEKKCLARVYAHEVMHALSGQQELLVDTMSAVNNLPGSKEATDFSEFDVEDDEANEVDEEELDENNRYKGMNVRIGLMLSTGLSNEQLVTLARRTHLRWLNEAMTERLTGAVLDLKTHQQAYWEERGKRKSMEIYFA